MTQIPTKTEYVQNIMNGWRSITPDSLDIVLQLVQPIQDKDHYDKMAALLDTVYETVHNIRESEDESFDPRLDALFKLIADRIAEYDAVHYPIEHSPAKALQYWADQHGYNQKDLSSKTGIVQSTVSQLLSGKREFNIKHCKAFADLFGVSIDVFVKE